MNYFISKYKNTALIALAVFSLSSCLKDEGAANGTYGMSAFAGGEFVSIPVSGSNPNALSLESKTGDQSLTLFQVNYENVDKAPEDIVVNFTKDDAAVATVSGLTLLPASVLTFSSANPSVTIAKGTRVSPNFTCKINTGTLDPNKSYGLAFTISGTSKSSIALPKNLKTVIYKIALKNKYDGIYKVTGTLVDVANSALGPWMPYWTAYVETTGPNSVAIRDMTYTGGIYHPIMSGGAASYYGTFGMLVDFDGATDKAINMVSPYEPAANTRTARLDANAPSSTNKFVPASHNIYLKYFMYQPSVTGSAPRVTFDEIFTYVGPRK